MPISRRVVRAITALAVMFAITLGMMVAVSGPASATEITPSTAVAATTVNPTIVDVTTVTPFDMASSSHGINMVDACAMTHHTTPQLTNAAYSDPYNPYSWYCLRKVSEGSSISYTASTDKAISASAEQNTVWEPLGGVDIQLYCKSTYFGTKAVVGRFYGYADVFSWSCVS